MLSARLIDFLLFSRPLDCNARPVYTQAHNRGHDDDDWPPSPHRTPYVGAGVDNPERDRVDDEIFFHEMRANFQPPSVKFFGSASRWLLFPSLSLSLCSYRVLKIIKSGLEF